MHDNEHDLHYVVFMHASEQLACTVFRGEELNRVQEDHQRVDRLRAKLREQLSAAQLLPAVAGQPTRLQSPQINPTDSS